MGTQRQKQKISISKKNPKTTKGKQWWKDNIDYYESRTTSYSMHKDKYLQLYRLAAGKLNELDYSYVTNPYNETRQELLGYPAKMKNYDIVSSIVQLLMGEKGKRPDNKTVVARNSDIKNIRKDQVTKEWKETLIQTFINEVNKTGVETGMESRETQTLEEIQAASENIQDTLSITGQEGLEYIYDFNEIPRMYRKGFYDWLVTARVFSYKGIKHKDTEYEVVSPMDFNYICSEDTDFVEDGESVWRMKKLTLAEVIDKWGDPDAPGGGLKDSELTELEANYERNTPSNRNSNTGFMSQTQVFYNSLFQIDEKDNDNISGIEVVHVVWNSMEQIGKRKWTDFFGVTHEDIVDEEYKKHASPDEDIDWIWVNVPYEGYKVDDRYYVGMQRLPIRRGSFENPSSSKLPYNGRVFGNRHVSPVSITEKLLAYQIQHNILHYRMEMTMAISGNRPIVFPLGLMPNKEGWDMYNTMYYMKATNFIFVDETKSNALAAINGLKSIDMGLGTYVDQINKYLIQNKAEAEDSIGISRQRRGAVAASDSVGGTQEAVFRSTVMTEELFKEFEEFQNREDQGLLDLSKYAWSGGKKATYVNSEQKIAMLEIIPEDYANAEYAVFAQNSGEELRKLEEMRAAAHAFAQNQASPVTIGKVIGTTNFNQMLKELEVLEKEMNAKEASAAQAETQKAEGELAFKQQEHSDNLNFDYYKTDKDSATKLEIEVLKGNNTLLAMDNSGNEVDMDSILLDLSKSRENLQVEREKIASTERIASDKNASAEKIAKENKNQFDTK